MKAPAFQFYPADFIMGTAEMTAEEVGGYIRGLCHQWAKDGLPNNRKKLEVILGIGGDSLDTVLEKFVLDTDGRLRNVRLEKVREEQDAYRARQAENGKKGGNPAFKKGEPNPYYKPQDNPKDNPPDNPKINPSSSSSPSTSSLSISTTPTSEVLSSADAPHQTQKKIEVEDSLKQPEKEATHTRGAAKFQKPTYTELQTFMETLHPGNPLVQEQAQRFLNYYDSNGWKVGRNPMKDWKATARNWKFPVAYDPQNEAGRYNQQKSQVQKRAEQGQQALLILEATRTEAA